MQQEFKHFVEDVGHLEAVSERRAGELEYGWQGQESVEFLKTGLKGDFGACQSPHAELPPQQQAGVRTAVWAWALYRCLYCPSASAEASLWIAISVFSRLTTASSSPPSPPPPPAAAAAHPAPPPPQALQQQQKLLSKTQQEIEKLKARPDARTRELQQQEKLLSAAQQGTERPRAACNTGAESLLTLVAEVEGKAWVEEETSLRLMAELAVAWRDHLRGESAGASLQTLQACRAAKTMRKQLAAAEAQLRAQRRGAQQLSTHVHLDAGLPSGSVLGEADYAPGWTRKTAGHMRRSPTGSQPSSVAKGTLRKEVDTNVSWNCAHAKTLQAGARWYWMLSFCACSGVFPWLVVGP
eukprot:jgi/Mesen1/2287/ME000154S01462